MSENNFILESHNDVSGLVAVLEDDGTSAWLYLSNANDRKPVADVWVHNRASAPLPSEIKQYRGGPPPAPTGFTDDSAICDNLSAHDWTFLWGDDDHAVVLYCDGTPMAILVASNRAGWSRNLLQDGPWGQTWDESLYNSLIHD